MRPSATAGVLAVLVAGVAGQNCISLQGSTTCPAFSNASISTDSTLVGFFPFLQFVSSRQDFDTQLSQYVSQQYNQRYVNLFGCDNVNLQNTTDYYARYTTSFVCNSIVQNSRQPCGLSDNNARPLCAASCSDFATSESEIVMSDAYCSGRSANAVDQLRADFTNCALPANSISTSCIPGSLNEPDFCGFADNLVGLCNYCQGSTYNDTDSCCLTSNAESRCQNVNLPVFSSVAIFSTSTPTSSGSTATASAGAGAGAGAATSGDGGGGGLSGGAIAGIVIGSIAGFALILGLIILGCILYRRRRQGSANGSLLNQPTPPRKGADVSAMSYSAPVSAQGYEVLPGGRVARMSAMQNDESAPVGQQRFSARELYGDAPGSPDKIVGAAGGMGGIRAVKPSPRSNGSSPGSNDFSSPEGVASGQSEQLPFFKDYYSNGDIHPNDKVSVLWAYQPRAGDEFELERGDMLRVVGIWDDGWATGVRIDDRAEDYEGKHKPQRDSGVSNGSAVREESPVGGEIKAFPLVCVCLPEAWRKTVEGDSSTESGSGGLQP